MKKRLVLICIVFILFIFFLLIYVGKMKQDTVETNNSIELKLPSGLKSVKIEVNEADMTLSYDKKTEFKHISSTDYQYIYDISKQNQSVGSLNVTFRELDNGDVFVFTKIHNTSKAEYRASVQLPFADSVSHHEIRYDEYGEVKREHNNTFGTDPSSHPIGLLEVQKNDKSFQSAMISKNYTSYNREKTYSNGQKSTVREFIEEWESYKISAGKDEVLLRTNLKVPGAAISENWILLANDQLFKDRKNIENWFTKSIQEYTTINKWLTADGVYSKLPWSVDPGFKMAFGRNLGNIQGSKYLDEYKKTNERYFYDLVFNSVADLDVFSDGAVTAGDVPVFKTEYTSSWLKNAYGTTAPYIDTRHNENVALFLKNTGELFAIPKLASANQKYADFLVDQNSIGNVIRINDAGYLIADYYAEGSKKTHVSLNHALGEMRFLIETYQQTKDKRYYDTAMAIKQGIEALYPDWIREDRDLWYQINGEMIFNGRDYPWLTLVDLLLSQELFAEIGIERSEIFDKMIESKLLYLKSMKQPLRADILELIQGQGFSYPTFVKED
ncbi:S-layer homology domain-containing protein [Peribacillus huizhouensis]|uniref:Uncharacterized protein n=1 Tax=Peribacillus huizhouensis TaxID=1501239 RepID=A0ABR6CNS8_9BACI|nr:S-layer homology domain-containing protein [Peribacillus huizhouensis]MBA9026699.1 hypothetical protein [Peribacillus huizhouensis]